jgi:photosystem II stability/assembly factor-like uncharacterized protein
MRRFLPALALVLALVGCGSAARRLPQHFRAEAAAAFGSSDVWILERGDTLVRSTDGGAHFVEVSFPRLRAEGGVPTLVFANASDGFAFLQDGDSPLYVTHDGGSTWSASLSRVTDVAVGGGRVFAIASNEIERSPVGREAWTALRGAQVKRASVAVEGARVWLLGPPRRKPDADTIQFSSDSGRTFTSYRGPCYFDLPGRLVPSGGSDVWAVCPSGMMASLLRSTDDGRTFPLQGSFHDPGGLQRPLLTNGAQIYPLSRTAAVVYPGVGAPLYRTADGGTRWQRAGESWTPQHAPFWLGFPTSNVGYALNATKLWRTTDAGLSWHVVPTS